MERAWIVWVGLAVGTMFGCPAFGEPRIPSTVVGYTDIAGILKDPDTTTLLNQCKALVGIDSTMRDRSLQPYEIFDEIGKANRCSGLINGFIAGSVYGEIRGGKLPYCIPGKTKVSVIILAFMTYAVQHPESSREDGLVTVMHSLVDVFPCK